MEKLHIGSEYRKNHEIPSNVEAEQHLIGSVLVNNDIIDEIVKLGYNSEFEEIKYRITDGENPNEILLDIFNRIELSPILMFYSKQLEDYLESDKYSKFFN